MSGSKEQKRVRLGVTAGDPAGIGAEVILKALSERGAEGGAEIVVYGSRELLELEDGLLQHQIRGYRSPLGSGEVLIREMTPEISWGSRPRPPGDKRCALLQQRALQAAMADAKSQEIDAIVTAPLNKALFALIDAPVVGHTELLAEYFSTPDVVMMLGGDRLKVALVTTHIALKDVAEALSADAIERTIAITAKGLRESFGVAAPRIAVCGLNPHAGEEGHMGREELDLITPLLEALRERPELEGVTLEGPLPADTLFAKFQGNGRPFDAVICMYHDQGLIPLKLLHFGESANITLGLPVIRTSVDHGTAYDIAAKAVADAGSMGYAMDVAEEMVRRRRAIR